MSKSDCSICKKHEDPHYELTTVYRDEHWLVRHSSDTNILGYFYIEARRHILDLSEATVAEAESYGVILKRLTDAMHQVVDGDRIYTFSLGESVAHYHLHVIPRRHDFPRTYAGRGIMSYPVKPEADPSLVKEVCDRVRRTLSARALLSV